MVFGSGCAQASRACLSVVIALSSVVGCSSSKADSPATGGAAGSATGGTSTGGTSTGANGGSSSPSSGQGGTAGATQSAGATGGGAAGADGPSSCLGLQRASTASPYYTPPNTTSNVSIVGTYQSGQGLLVALDLSDSIRLLAVDKNGGASELLNESEYTPNWSFTPTEVVAIQNGDAVDVLVTDNADAALIHKQGTQVTLTPLAQTDFMDLHVLGFAPTASGTLAMYWKGDQSTGTDETLTVLDISSMQKTTRTFHGASGLVLTPHATGAWLSAERLDFDTDCQATGDTMSCGGGTDPVPTSTCTWHVDVWNVTSNSFTTADPLATFDAPATISARCSDSTPAGLATYPSSLGSGLGIGPHHAAALDQDTQGLALALQLLTMPNMRGVQFELLGPSGDPSIAGTTASLPVGNSQSWLAVRAGDVFMCSGDECAMSNASAATSFRFSSAAMSVSVDAVALRADGLALIGGINGNPLLRQLVSCQH